MSCESVYCKVNSAKPPTPNDTIATPQPKEVDVAYVALVMHGYDQLLQNTTKNGATEGEL